MINKSSKEVIYTDINGKTGKVAVEKLFFRPSVYGVLIEGNKILLSKQWDGYDFPGGGMKIEENIKDALKREFWEETGLEVEVGDVILTDSSFFKYPYADKYCNSILVYYLVRRVGGKLSIDNCDDNEQKYLGMPEWIDLDDIEKIKFYNSIDSMKLIDKVKRILK